MANPTTTTAERLRALPDRWRTRIRVDESGCWIWTGYLSKDGYARTSIDGRGCEAYRAIWRLFNGDSSGRSLDHLCRVRACVNPEHLEAVSQRENVLRGDGLPAQYARRTRCDKGHEFSTSGTGPRWCPTCENARNAKRRQDPAFRESRRDYNRRYYKENRERILAQKRTGTRTRALSCELDKLEEPHAE